MIQLALWKPSVKQQKEKIPVFRVFIKTRVYVGIRQVFRFFDVMDFVLFTSNGGITSDQDAAAYVVTRREGQHIEYAVWRAHSPEQYQRELIFKINAGYAHRSVDTLAWKHFIKASKAQLVETRTDYQRIG